jgi:NAD+ kinase
MVQRIWCVKIRVKIIKKRDYPELKKIYRNFIVSEDAELCLAVGGDGTFLKAARRFNKPILPIRSEEKDSLGFHADVSLKDLDKVIEELRLGHYTIERYPRLRAKFKNKYYDAVNDVVLSRGESPKTLHCRIYQRVNDKKELLYPWDITGDGIIFSSYIGSTAYNWKCGGPIIYKTDVILVTPLSAYPSPSIITKDSFLVEITKNEGVLQYDGINIDKVREGDSFGIKNSDKYVEIVKLNNLRESFASKLARLYSFKSI